MVDMSNIIVEWWICPTLSLNGGDVLRYRCMVDMSYIIVEWWICPTLSLNGGYVPHYR